MRTCCKYLGGNWASSNLKRQASDEDGSFTIFGLFIFLMIIMVAGLAVDMMRYENERVGVQNTLDTAVVAATRLNQDADTNQEVEDLVKSYFSAAGYDPEIVRVNPNIEIPAGGTEETVRTIEAVVDFNMDTAFMNLLGIDELPGVVGGGAREGQQIIEVALVLDISGSMRGRKLQDMKDAARSFVTSLVANNGEDRVMISIIPYNGQVHMSSDLMNRLNLANSLVEVVPAPTHPGAIEQYNTRNPASHCVRFLDADFDTLALSAGAELVPSAKFRQYGNSYNRPNAADFFCGTGTSVDTIGRPEMLLYQSNELALHTYIDSLVAGGWTAVDYGFKWGAGVLDPAFRPVVQGMLADTLDPDQSVNLVPAHVAGHPVNYGADNVFKYLVIMTDGANTEHRDLADPFKSGPSRVWYSDDLKDAKGGTEFDGFLVEMPLRSSSERWYRPGDPNTTNDDEYLADSEIQPGGAYGDAVQWSYHQIYDRFALNDVHNYFFRTDADAKTAHQNAQIDTGGYGTADVNLARTCDVAQAQANYEVFTVAFEANEIATAALQRCSLLDPTNFYAVAGSQLTAAFNNIAAEITKLRLTQ